MGSTLIFNAATERHYTVKEVAGLWRLAENTVRKIFMDDPAVIKFASPRLLRKERKRAAPVSLRIPESALIRAHENWSRAPRTEVKAGRRVV